MYFYNPLFFIFTILMMANANQTFAVDANWLSKPITPVPVLQNSVNVEKKMNSTISNPMKVVNMEKKINLNTATKNDLMKIKYLNQTKVKAILSYRKKHGAFKAVDDMVKIRGFGKMKAEKLKQIQSQLTI